VPLGGVLAGGLTALLAGGVAASLAGGLAALLAGEPVAPGDGWADSGAVVPPGAGRGLAPAAG
jgi:hypothetical protein